IKAVLPPTRWVVRYLYRDDLKGLSGKVHREVAGHDLAADVLGGRMGDDRRICELRRLKPDEFNRRWMAAHDDSLHRLPPGNCHAFPAEWPGTTDFTVAVVPATRHHSHDWL